MSLVLSEVSYRYPGTTQGLRGVSIDVKSGELVAVMGPSGSGKSTLLKLVSGLTTGHTGRIILGGVDLAHKPVHQRNIGMVFQSYALFPHLTVLQNIGYGLKVRGLATREWQRKAHALLDTVDMAEFADRPVTQLSGGQQQRVALARALAIDPKALLLDEPLAALDATIRGHLRDQIRQIQRRFKATTLLVTHDQEEALTMADRVAVLKDGMLLQLATPKDIYNKPACKAVAEFVGLSTVLPATVVAQDRIDTGFAVLTTPTGTRSVGTSVFALIRPEHVEADPPLGTPNTMQGTTGTQRYLGASLRYDFHAEGASQPLTAQARAVAVKAVAVAPDHVCLLDF